MRLIVALTCGVLASCTSGNLPGGGNPAVLVEVPRPGVDPYPANPADPYATYPYSTAPAPPGQVAEGDFTSRIEGALDGGGSSSTAGLPPGGTTPLDDDRLNLTLYTIEQQKLDAAAAERDLADARSQLVIVEPGTLPNRVSGANIALFAQQTTHGVGERRYSRSGGGGGFGSGCRQFATADEAQRAFLASGGPERDPNGLDRDGDGFACGWDPAPYRQLRF